MLAVEFTQVYDRQFTTGVNPSFEVPQLGNAQNWALQLGYLLHDRLANPTIVDPTQAKSTLADYFAWGRESLMPLENAIRDNLPSDDALRLHNEVNFHRMSLAMAGMWQSVADREAFTDQRRLEILQLGQVSLALQGIGFYRTRERFSTEKASFQYFDESLREMRTSLEGAAMELDAAIILLDLAKKRPDLTIVPAPPQFERTFTKCYNADFIAFNDKGQVVGIQIKSKVTPEDLACYDKERIELVDGHSDMGNTLVKRTTKKRFDPHPICWGGLICAQYFHNIPTTGRAANLLVSVGLNPREILVTKMEARQMTKDIKPNLQIAKEKIGQRILRHLAA